MIRTSTVLMRSAVVLAAVCAMVRPSAAQGMNGVTFEAGYEFAHASQGGFGETFPAGFVVDVVHDLKRMPSGRLGVVGGVSLAFGSAEAGESDRILTAMGGVRWTKPVSHDRSLFVQAEAGLGRTSASFSANSDVGVGGDSSNAFAFQFGGGLTLPLGKRSPDVRAFPQGVGNSQVSTAAAVSNHDHGLGLMIWFIFTVITDPSLSEKVAEGGAAIRFSGK